jgi:hypothetical protein
MIVSTIYALPILRGKETPMPDVILYDEELSNSAYFHVISPSLTNIDTKLTGAFRRRAL